MSRLMMKLLAGVMALMLAALGLAMLPAVRRQAQQRRDARAVDEYQRTVDVMDSLESGTWLAQARRYNEEALADVRLADALAPGAMLATDAAYESLLDPCGNGVMAVLEIPKLGAAMPVYHGTDISTLETGAIHLPGTGLPVSGDGAACALVAENGTKAARLFAELDRLLPGDCFTLRVMQETLAFQVERTGVVDAAELPEVSLEDDMCALITRARGEDADRLLVLARRIPLRNVPLWDDTWMLPNWTTRLVFAAPVLLAGLMLLAIMETIRRGIALVRLKRKKL